MTRILVILCVLLISQICFSQDLIITIDKKVIQCKILEVGIDKVRYKNVDIKKSPVFEILIADIHSIRYSSGYFQKYNTSPADSVVQDSTGNISYNSTARNPDGSIDTTKFAMLYFVYHSRSSDDLLFPLYFNGQYICKLKNNTRLQYKIFSAGMLTAERKSRSFGGEPMVNIDVAQGGVYGINIEIANPQAYAADRRFSMQLITEPTEVKNFIENEFYGFKPFKTCDFKLQEDPNDLLIE